MRNYTKGTRVYRRRRATERDVVEAIHELIYQIKLQGALKQIRRAVAREIGQELARKARS